jgi:phosphate starvation-inducible PhoH-like protein
MEKRMQVEHFQVQDPKHVAVDLFDKPSALTKSQRRQANKARARAQKETAFAARVLKPLNATQAEYLDSLHDPEVTQIFAVGEAGTGKTYLPARIAAKKLRDGLIEKIYIARPTVSLKEHQLGFLPGKLKDKLAPWLVPILDAFKAELPAQVIAKMMETQQIEFISFEHLRGRTLANAYVILDEAQNCTLHDLKLFLTRKGEDSTYVIAGDPTQVDINNSGLEIVLGMIVQYDLPVDIIEFDENDVVRSADAKAWVKAFKKHKAGEEPATH